MSQFHPTSRMLLPEHEPDFLAGAVHDSLTRKLYYPLSWGVGTTLVAAVLSCGIAPIVAMLGWLRGVIRQHEQQFWHLGEWLRLQTGDPDAAELQKLAQQIQFRPALAAGTAIGLAVAIVGLLMHFNSMPFDIRAVFAFAYEFPRGLLGILFSMGLIGASACNWIHSSIHQQSVERCVRFFNTMAEEHGLEPIPLAGPDLGLRPLWIGGGVLLTIAGAIWGVPVMVAGGAHRRYTIGTSVLIRSMLAERMRTILETRRPPIRVPAPVVAARTCVRPNCRAPIHSAAGYCPRCGTKAARLMDVVA